MRGEVTNTSGLLKGYCFSTVTDEKSRYNNRNVMIHAKFRSCSQAAFDQLRPGDIVEFDVEDTQQGLRGVNLQVCGRGERFRGRIIRLMRNVGFIELEDGRSFYFRWRSCRWFVTDSDIGAEVEFSLIEEDKKTVAVSIIRI